MKTLAAGVLFLLACSCPAQDRLPTMPRYDRYEKMRSDILEAVKGGTVDANWAPDGKSFTFLKEGRLVRYDVADKKISEANEASAEIPPETKFEQAQRGRLVPGRGRQFGETFSSDGRLRAFCKDRNVFISNTDGSNLVQVTADGSVRSRTMFGQAPWVYGEELDMREAMWWSPDSKMLAYYGFDESKVPDYYVLGQQAAYQDTLNTEAYPIAGAPNPKASLYIYNVEAKTNYQVDTDLDDPSVGEYVYDIAWSPDGKSLLYKRTNRQQNRLQFVAVDPSNGKARVVVDENWSKTWTENHPPITWLAQKPGQPQRFLWISERNGFRNIYLGDLSGAPLRPITEYDFEVDQILGVDEKEGVIFFTARDGNNPYRVQLHRIGLDGKEDKRLTDPEFNHSVKMAPDFKHFVDVEQNLTTPATSLLCDDNGKTLDTLSQADLTRFNELGLKKAERFMLRADDQKTDIYGYLTFPSDFDPSKKYPLLLAVYGGPDSGSNQERFVLPNPITEFGFVTAWIDGRGTTGRGKAFKDAVYRNLGIVEINDQADGVKYLSQRAYIDGTRVGVYGTSYGGYASLMCLLRHPETFQVACSSSPVTDWRNYDSIYTERYMGQPTDSDNGAGYANGAAVKYVRNLKGRLMLYYGTADDNVHPSNTLQLVQALQTAGKSFDMMVGPDMGHSGMNMNRQWEYFIDYLILNRDKQPLAKVYDARRRRIARSRAAGRRSASG